MCNIKLKEATQTFRAKAVEDALEITVLNTKTSSASGGFDPMTPTGGSAPGPPLGAPPPDTHYRLALPRSPWVCALLKNPYNRP